MSEAAETYRFSVDEYHRLGEAGILGEDDRVELLEGNLIVMSPIHSRHARAVRKLNRTFSRELGDRCLVDCQNAFTLSQGSEPQPDILLLRLDLPDQETLPGPEDVLLIVEVSDSSLGYDRSVKLQAYAAGGIPEVWIVNLVGNVVECYREPQGRSYVRTAVLRPGESLEVEALPGSLFAVADLLP